MAKTKQVSINQIDKIIASQASKYPRDNKITLSYDLGNDEIIDIEVTPLLSVDDANSMVQAVTEAIFNYDTYMPTVYELVYSKAVLVYYTNLKSDIKNDKFNQIVYQTDIVDKIINNVNKMQLADINYAIDKAIEFKKQEILSTQKKLLETAILRINSEQNDISTQISEAIKFFEKLELGMKKVDIQKLAQDVSKIANVSDSEFVNNVLVFQAENGSDN